MGNFLLLFEVEHENPKALFITLALDRGQGHNQKPKLKYNLHSFKLFITFSMPITPPLQTKQISPLRQFIVTNYFQQSCPFMVKNEYYLPI